MCVEIALWNCLQTVLKVMTINCLTKTVSYEMGGPGFDSLWGCWKFSSDLILLFAFIGLKVHLASDRNEYQGISLGVKCSWCVELTTLPSEL
jgi:hypothetical protein